MKLLNRPSHHKNCHPLGYATCERLSGKDLHEPETTDLGLFMRSTQLLRLKWKLVLTYLSESYK